MKLSKPQSPSDTSKPQDARSTNKGTGPDELRERIVRASRECFIRFGIDKTSMSNVASQAALSRGTVYRYFNDRAGLVEAVFAYESHLFHEKMRERMDRLNTLEDQVVACAGILATFEQEVANGVRTRMDVNGESLALMLTTHSEPLLRDTIEFLVPYVESAIERGETREDLDARQAAEWISRMLFTISSMPAVTFSGNDPKAYQRFFRDHIMRGLSS